jgi:hypothetical protein
MACKDSTILDENSKDRDNILGGCLARLRNIELCRPKVACCDRSWRGPGHCGRCRCGKVVRKVLLAPLVLLAWNSPPRCAAVEWWQRQRAGGGGLSWCADATPLYLMLEFGGCQ